MIIGALCVWNGVLRAFFDPVANALVADLASDAERVSAFSLQRLGANVGWSAGPVVAGLALTAGVSYSTLFFWSAPITFVAALGLLFVPTGQVAERRSAESSRWADLLAYRHDRAFLWFLLGSVAFFILQAQLMVTLSYFAARILGLGKVEVTHIYTLNGLLVVVLLQLPAVVYIRKVGRQKALSLGCLGYALSFAAVGLTKGHLSLLACVAAVTVAEVLSSPSQQATVPSMAPPGRIGAYSGMYGLAQITGHAAGPLLGTTILAAAPPRLAWFALGLFGVLAAICYRTGSRAAAGQRETSS